MTAKIIERQTDSEGMETLIMDHHIHGRLYGEMRRQSEGDVFRWDLGFLIKIGKDETIESIEALKATEWNEHTNQYDAMIHGYDDDHPVLPFPGRMIEAMVMAAD